MLLTHANLATLEGSESYGLIPDGAVWMKGGRLQWVGSLAGIPKAARQDESLDLEGRLVTPGLVDCHTHIVHGGNRAAEFEARLNGASYEEISRSGGGIISTVSATRAASQEELLGSALTRVDALIAEGVTTLEIKSGYGLDIEAELKMLRVARQVASIRPVRIRTSFLGAHALPHEYQGRQDAYLTDVCLPAMEAAKVEGLVDAVDGFCETIAFAPESIRIVFDKAQSLNLPVKLHAEQLSWLGGAQLAAEYSALSCDHLEHATREDAEAMGRQGSVAVLLPGAFYFLRETKLPPIAAFRVHGVPMAIATDCNPGSSPMTSLLSAMNMACVLFRLTPEEVLRGVTRNGAMALGLEDVGRMRAGQAADFAVWDAEHPAELSSRIGFNPLYKRIYSGEIT
ncbi:imidazolonepropionase [Hyphomonas jannaschiana]